LRRGGEKRLGYEVEETVCWRWGLEWIGEEEQDDDDEDDEEEEERFARAIY